MRIDSAGNVGIGTNSPAHALDVSGATRLNGVVGARIAPAAAASLSVGQDGSNFTLGTNYALFISGSGYSGGIALDATSMQIGQNSSSRSLTFHSGTSFAERMRIDSSGNLLVGTTSTATPTQGFVFDRSTDSLMRIGHTTGTASGSNYVIFGFNAGVIGSITQSGTTAVAYNTSSDYRLKHDIQPMTGALAKVQQLKPVTYKWNADDSQSQGFIAHELQEVVPECVTGEKDAVDAEGNPVYQGIDTSFLVATLTAALQEAVAEINSLKARLDAANL
jgi:hypothetical protein